MKSISKNTLALDETNRVAELYDNWQKTGNLSREKLFRFKSVIGSLALEKISLPGFNSNEILISFPFHDRIFVQFCSHCPFDEKVFIPLMESEQIIPVLIGSYKFYRSSVLKKLLRYPHLSWPELRLFQEASLAAREQLLCEGCLSKRFDKEIFKGFQENKDSFIAHITKSFFHNLYPFPESDSELIEQFIFAASQKNWKKMEQLQEMSSIIKQLRTAEIFKATISLDAEEFKTAQDFGIQIEADKTGLKPSVEHLIAENLEIMIPKNMSTEKYVEIILPHKPKLAKIVRELAVKSRAEDGNVLLGKLIGEIGSINEQIRKAQKTRRYSALQASAGLVSTNPFLIGSILAAGGVGLCSSMLGCNASLAASLGGGAIATTGAAKFATKALKTKWDNRVLAYKESLVKDLKQQFTGFMSTYLQMDVRAVQIWQVRKDLDKGLSKK
jgi:hypothetical protein